MYQIPINDFVRFYKYIYIYFMCVFYILYKFFTFFIFCMTELNLIALLLIQEIYLSNKFDNNSCF
jgi:hypothetical protein